MHTPEASGEPEPYYQYIDYIHLGAFVARFVVQRLVDGQVISQTRLLGRMTHHRGQRIDLTTLHFHGQRLNVGDHVRLRIGAVGGVRRSGPSVAYAPNREAARFEVRGTTLAFTIRQH
ncbi:hypothetical protein [Lysobacter sp. cf310]|uniref:hypothetical protein n=1 Tax=Lysobacter sp. cf310 TaxID=1761790 RepID=UPI0008F188F0|nr:hypothetical protein [Lysobacter sp. cf310]SFL29654.1 hypothetical protein SAMN04487938_4040 [Lysobacter sp. cf310]